jgi:TPR repeat protein
MAQFNLGLCYNLGEGVAQDSQEAVKWYRLAVEQGNVKAQFNLGNNYSQGDGVAQDK